ncbi:MAG: hypothetical protein A3J24_10970 [Deltaproteobacteria bacterium RIFCSPLOWO2_02_FULL_53_8]|nr:MAG: hypothetical protein A3J24_10970 [Deltaproteobacteria bacterium RIFCSPLOWO2_02_FULL_53_8]
MSRNLRPKQKHIQICGGIASGKTTLAALLSNLGVCVSYENFSANPFYRAFYRDPSANAFETEITFLLQHFHALKHSVNQERNFCCDYSLVLDLAYADITLKDKHRKIFMAVYREAQRIVGSPNFLIHLRCDPLEELRRIHRRRRVPELSITTDYLMALNAALARRVTRQSAHSEIIEIDSGQIDFARDEDHQKKVLALIARRLRAAKK